MGSAPIVRTDHLVIRLRGKKIVRFVSGGGVVATEISNKFFGNKN